jgi:hypothetical protein
MISLGHCSVQADIWITQPCVILFIFRHCQPSSLTNSILDPHISNCKSEPPQIKLLFGPDYFRFFFLLNKTRI